MKSKKEGKLLDRTRVVFCLALTAVLLVGMLALDSFAAVADPSSCTVKVDSCLTHTAAVAEGDLYVWGLNSCGQFPNSDLTYSVQPVKVASSVKDVAVSENRTLVLYESGRLYSFGKDPLTGVSNRKDFIAAGVKQMSCSDDFALLVKQNGAVMAWGVDLDGQLGIEGGGDRSTPIQIMDSGVEKVCSGDGFAMALTEDGALYGWGLNGSLQLGYTASDGSVPQSLATPTLLMETGVQDISLGSSYACILKTDGSLWTCGRNDLCQLGVGSLDDYLGPHKILDNVCSVSAGDSHAFAICRDGTIYAWGLGLSGQLGDGTNNTYSSPTLMEMDFVQIYACGDSTFGVDASGALWSWGSNMNLLLGRASGNDAKSPIEILDSNREWTFSAPGIEDTDDGESSTDTPNTSDSSDSTDETPDEEETGSAAFVSGYSDGTFRPNEQTTRAEFLSMLVNAIGGFDADTDYGTSTFTDVSADTWYAPFVAYAQQTGLVEGYKDNTFRPDASITRAEAAAMAAAALKLDLTATESSFTDVSGWAVPHVEALASRKLLAGDGDGTFRPDDPIIRSEAVTVVAVAAGFDPTTEEAESAILDAENPFTDVEASSWCYPFILRAAGLVK